MASETRGPLFRFSLIQALYFGIFAITSYQTIFLQDAGMSSAQIGFITAVSSGTGLVFAPVWGIVSDRLHSAKGTFLLCISATALMYALLPMLGNAAGGGFGFYAVYIPAIFAFKQASNAMLDSWCIGRLTPLGIGYGSVRMWGSAGYCVSSMLLGVLAERLLPVNRLFVLMLPLLAVLLWTGSRVRQERTPKAQENPAEKGSPGLLLKNRRFLIYLCYALGLNIYLAVTLIFMPYILEAAGCKASQLGLVTGFRALIEIVSMFLGAKLCKRVAVKYVMLLPGVLFGIEHLCYSFAAGIPSMLCIMALSGLAGGFFYSLGPSYIFEIVPGRVVHMAQTLNAMDLTLMSIVGSAVGGVVIKNWGVRTLTAACGFLILALTALFALSLRREPAK